MPKFKSKLLTKGLQKELSEKNSQKYPDITSAGKKFDVVVTVSTVKNKPQFLTINTAEKKTLKALKTIAKCIQKGNCLKSRSTVFI